MLATALRQRMSETDDRRAFEFDYRPGKILCRRGCTADLGAELDRRGLDRALVVCGSTVGSTPGVMDPVRDGLGDRLAGVFDQTTPEKYLRTAVEGAAHVREADADAVVAVGGGSSLDTAKVVSALTTYDDPPEEVGRRAVEEEALPLAADRDPVPIVAVPTTLAGADLSVIAGVKLVMEPDEHPDDAFVNGGVGDERLMPTALFYDADLYRTTPKSVLTASAMNGFDKGVEALYTRHSTPVTDGTAVRGLRLLQSGLPTLREDPMDPDDLNDVLAGVVLVQYGVSTPGSYKLSIIHAFGHGFSRDYDVHQGAIHGIVAPHVLRYLFDNVDGRRHLLAEAFDVDTDERTDDEVAKAVVAAVAGVRDSLGLPDRLRDVDGLSESDLDDIAEVIVADSLMDTVPSGLDPTVDDVEAVLREAW